MTRKANLFVGIVTCRLAPDWGATKRKSARNRLAAQV